jgi:hypothetical protein
MTFSGRTRDLNDFLFELLGPSGYEVDKPNEIPGGATVTLLEEEMAKGGDIPIAAQVLIDLATGVVGSIVAAYIYDKLKKSGGKVKLSVDERTVEITPEGIKKIVESHIKFEKED